MAKTPPDRLSRRERQIVEILYQRREASTAQIVDALPDPPSYSAIRATLSVMEEKGLVRHLQRGKKYVYQPTQPRRKAARIALRQVLATFFGGSVSSAVATLLSDEEIALTDEELARLGAMIEAAQQGEEAR
jgi:predicted transcriptional regulator